MNPDQWTQWTRSTHCGTGSCLTVRWTKSSHSGGNGCVEARTDRGAVQVRDSKLHDSPILTFGVEQWQAFIDAVKASGL